ncbi:PadR family transcriptional regulator [uncultured Brachyspira sp.]|uniref:PadR family transcriptional regulator n=1 Tax=uncultured Brachyspira sp. TaxID=221953 RepID=UPI0025E834EB|nr:PadR family transcriptional regulator [uncultured Brachyspira sp.]
MGVLKYAILGLLNKKSMTGYDITKEFEEALCEFWSAKHSQIYPELKTLHEQSMVEYKIEISGTVLEKKLYSITELGKKDFMKWLESKKDIPPTFKDEFRLQLFFSDFLSEKNREELIVNHLNQHRDRLEHLRNNQKKFDSIPEKNTNAFSDYLVLMGAIMREENTCRWLEKCLELCGK